MNVRTSVSQSFAKESNVTSDCKKIAWAHMTLALWTIQQLYQTIFPLSTYANMNHANVISNVKVTIADRSNHISFNVWINPKHAMNRQTWFALKIIVWFKNILLVYVLMRAVNGIWTANLVIVMIISDVQTINEENATLVIVIQFKEIIQVEFMNTYFLQINAKEFSVGMISSA